MARHPNQVSPYGPLRAIKGKRVRPEPGSRKVLQERDLKSLDEAQAKRPLKPPGRR